MKIKTLDMFKIPEGIRVPILGGLLYSWISKWEQKEIQKILPETLSLNKSSRAEKVVVSLTSFPARINVVGYSILSLFNQTYKPDRIVLWLAESQFPEKILPPLLSDLCKQGLEVRFCEEDLRSHKKYYYALQEQKKDELIITYDDDLIYPENSIELLVNKHQEYPDCIVCNRAQACEEKNGLLMPYADWRVLSNEGVYASSARLFPSTGGGTLYPYGSVCDQAFDMVSIKETAFSADDLWMRFMSALKDTKIIKTRKYHRPFSTLSGSQEESLQTMNCIGGENDCAIQRLSLRYPSAVANILRRV